MKHVKFSCTQPQSKFLQLPFPKLFVGGVGAGKTTVGVLQALQMPEGSRGCVIAPTYPMLRDVIVQSFATYARKLIIKHDRVNQEIHLQGGRVILLRSAMLPERLRGLNLDWLWIDEATYVAESAYNVAVARLRKNPTRWWLTCTPRRPSWVYDKIVQAQTANILTAPTTSNTYLPAEYAQSLKSVYDSRLAQRELMAEWIELGGALIDSSWIRIVDGLQYEHGAYAVLGIDLAAGMGETADYTAMVVVTTAQSGKLQVDAAVRGRWSFSEQVQRAVQLIEAHQVKTIVVESNAYQIVFAQELAKLGYRVVPYQARTAKSERIATLAPLYEMGLIQHARRLPELEAELVGYPDTDHDDLLDALVYALYAARRVGTSDSFVKSMRVVQRERVL